MMVRLETNNGFRVPAMSMVTARIMTNLVSKHGVQMS
ncbi:hypothetical protein MTR67_002512 [Solanum verrucosum]|uniref:Uncharacterized protein n=1 Tax=Solanum verrucosum TaxID=315347 RepID=A0AAF0T5Z3_SOLVR|nr:hypothetical protein MTR67_002512 [Solanum verrucosum]